MLVLDFDNGLSLEAAKSQFAEYTCAIYTTYSHQSNGMDKFRVILPLAAPVSPYDIKKRNDNLLNWAGSADKSTFAIGRYFYLPSCDQANAHLAEIWTNDGVLFDVKAVSVDNAQTKSATTPTHKEFSLSVKESVKNALKQIGEVDHDPYYKIAAAMSNSGMGLHDFLEVAEYLKPDHDIAKRTAQWEYSSGLTSISPGFLINLLKAHGYNIYTGKPKAGDPAKAQLINERIALIKRSIALAESSESLSDDGRTSELAKLNAELTEQESQLNEALNGKVDVESQIRDLLATRFIAYVMDDDMIHEYDTIRGAWNEYSVKAFVKGHPFINSKAGEKLLFTVLDSLSRIYKTKTCSPAKQPDKVLNLFRKDHWLQPKQGQYHKVFDILIRSLADNKAENLLHIQQVLAWKYLHPEDYQLPSLNIYGEGGAGKNTLIERVLGTIFGRNQVLCIQQSTLKSFNGQLSGKVVVMLDESVSDKADMEQLKAIIGQQSIYINPKYGKPYVADNSAMYFTGGNGALGAILLDKLQSDRRFSILHVSRSIIDHTMEVESLEREEAIEWWDNHKHYLEDPEHVACWLHSILQLVQDLKTTPSALHGQDYQLLVQAQSGPFEATLDDVFSAPEFEFISKKELYRLYQLKCEEYGVSRYMARQTFDARLPAVLNKQYPHVIANGKQRVKLPNGDYTNYSGWVNVALTGAAKQNHSYIIENPRIRGKEMINPTPYAAKPTDLKPVESEHQCLMED